MSLSKNIVNKYSTILGRNIYNQNRRQYVLKPYSNGNYYSDCSSSICAVMESEGVSGMRDDGYFLNTESMHYDGKKVNVEIKNGHIVSGIENLRLGDCLMFRGNDPSRPLQIGHVEMIYDIYNYTEKGITIAGHGSGNPSTKNMYTYLSNRESQTASNGKTKGLVEVRRFIPDEGPIEIDISHYPKISKGYKDSIETGGYCAEMQRAFISFGITKIDNQEFVVDGSCGGRTETAIKIFQQMATDAGIYTKSIDGKCGPGTWKALDEMRKNLGVSTGTGFRVKKDIMVLSEDLYHYDDVVEVKNSKYVRVKELNILLHKEIIEEV